ncbi:unnamed protein product, partial [Choristocarpus tenellus]
MSSFRQLCMEVSVFVFCMLIAALGSGLAVASHSFAPSVRTMLTGREPSGYNPRLKRCNASGMLSTASEKGLVNAAAAMDRAAAAPLEREDKVPPRFLRAFCGNLNKASERWKTTLAWRRENDVDTILNEPQPYFSIIKEHFPSFMCVYGRSRQGHVVVYDKLAGVDMHAMAEQGVTVPVLLRHWIFCAEYMWRVVHP